MIVSTFWFVIILWIMGVVGILIGIMATSLFMASKSADECDECKYLKDFKNRMKRANEALKSTLGQKPGPV